VTKQNMISVIKKSPTSDSLRDGYNVFKKCKILCKEKVNKYEGI